MMLLERTDKGRDELKPGVRTLGLRERSLLLLAEGKPLAELQAMYHGGGASLVDQLLTAGYLRKAAGQPLDDEPAVQAIQAVQAAQPAATPAPPITASAIEVPRQATVRSLASTRMYLFDQCERLFARRDPQLAEQFREALRAARDESAMLDVGMALADEVNAHGSPERAQALREYLGVE